MTPSWWTDLWLNEGFASYVEYLGVEASQPQLKLLEQFVSHDMQHVLTIDSLATSHPISIPVKHPDEVNEIFDRISYAKGSCCLKMSKISINIIQFFNNFNILNTDKN